MVGKERTGRLAVHLLIDRFLSREPLIVLEAIRYGSRQVILLPLEQTEEVLRELTRVHRHQRRTARAMRQSGRQP